MKSNFYTFIIGGFFSIAATTVNAQSGSLDNTFDTDGIVTTNFGASAENGRAMAIQSNGKIVVAGAGFNGTSTYFTLARYNSNGSLDITFDSDGMVTTNVGNESKAYAIAIQPDGKIVAAGYSDNGVNRDFAVVRYDSTGALDLTFDTDGMVTTIIGTGGGEAYSVALQSDGKIILGGYASFSVTATSDDFALVRYKSNGSLDSTFDSDGIVTTAIGTLKDEGNSVAIQTDGKIILAGHSDIGGTVAFATARYKSNGVLDSTFDADGIATYAFVSNNSEGNSAALQSDGKIVVTGFSDSGTKSDFALIRCKIDGSLDSTFGVNGKVTTAIGSADDESNSIVIQSDGKIVVAGKSDNGSDDDFAVARYKTDGSLDTSFSADGKVTTSIASVDDEGFGVAIQADGKIVVAGENKNGSPNFADFAVVRYNNALVGAGVSTIVNQTEGFKIYPNPSTGIFKLEWNGDKNASVKIFNLLGGEVLQQQITNKIDLSTFGKGVFFVMINNGAKTYTQKIIVQ